MNNSDSRNIISIITLNRTVSIAGFIIFGLVKYAVIHGYCDSEFAVPLVEREVEIESTELIH